MTRKRQHEHFDMPKLASVNFIDVPHDGRYPSSRNLCKLFMRASRPFLVWGVLEEFARKVAAWPAPQTGTVDPVEKSLGTAMDVNQRYVAKKISHVRSVKITTMRNTSASASIPVRIETPQIGGHYLHATRNYGEFVNGCLINPLCHRGCRIGETPSCEPNRRSEAGVAESPMRLRRILARYYRFMALSH